MDLTYKDVADIIKIIDASSCDEVVLELAGSKIVVRRGGRGGDLPAAAPAALPVQQAPSAPAAAQSPAPSSSGRDQVAVSENQHVVRSPMVGTYYQAPSPNDPPFISVGSIVKVGDPLCIIEVMKLFTTVEADRAGKVVAIFPENAQLVEFGQPLVAIEPI
jgi:acetyl-CoA carboxylase biotin carboxyl carrier protein